jgi:Ca2+-binding RTX toxin-like protein
MPSFTLNSFSSTARTLAAGETGYVGRTGELVTSGSAAITLSGAANVIVHGVVASLTNSAIASGDDGFNLDLVIGSTGEVSSTGVAGVKVTVDTSARIVNAGTIQGMTEGVTITATGASADLDLVNTGTIARVDDTYGVKMTGGTGSALQFENAGIVHGWVELVGVFLDVQNSGTIHGQVRFDDASNVDFANTGDVLGSVNVFGDPVDSEIRNEGTITGNVSGGGGVDIYRGNGQVGGTINLGAGDDLYLVTRADLTIFEGFFNGSDSVQAHMDWALGRNFENLRLYGPAAVNGTGNGLANRIEGNENDNLLRGRRGDDTLEGGEGDDTLQGGDGNDTFFDITGDNSLAGGEGTDTLDLTDDFFCRSTCLYRASGAAHGRGQRLHPHARQYRERHRLVVRERQPDRIDRCEPAGRVGRIGHHLGRRRRRHHHWRVRARPADGR